MTKDEAQRSIRIFYEAVNHCHILSRSIDRGVEPESMLARFYLIISLKSIRNVSTFGAVFREKD